jgi:SHOCT-like protein
MDEERLQVLRLVESGHITPEQAAELLRALGTPQPLVGPSIATGGSRVDGPQWLRIRVTDQHGHPTADVQLPLSIVRVALGVGGRWLPQLRMLDPSWVIQTLRERGGRPVFTFKDAADGDRVVIWVD